MGIRFFIVFSTVLCMHMAACQREVKAPVEVKKGFNPIPTKLEVNPMIAEASGIADSRKNQGYLWVEEDSGNPPELYLLSHTGSTLKKVFIKGAGNRDWEDLSLCNNKIYIAETGDNSQTYSTYAFYIFPEPDKSVDTIFNFQKIAFRYPDRSHDAEAFLVDPITEAIYVITKRDSLSAIYKLSAPPSSSGTLTAELVGQLKFNGVTSASISPDGKEIILKTYTSLLYYQLNDNETIESLPKKDAVTIPYDLEPQGEAITFAADNSGYFTLSEKGFSSKQYLFFYKRN